MPKKSSHGKFFLEYLAFCGTKRLKHSPKALRAWAESLKAEGYTQKEIEIRIVYVRQQYERKIRGSPSPEP